MIMIDFHNVKVTVVLWSRAKIDWTLINGSGKE
jgi:hypothetical protein